MQGLQAILIKLLPTHRSCLDVICLDVTLSSYDKVGLPDLHPALFQSGLLSKIQMEEVHRHPEFDKCVEWFEDIITYAMHQADPLVDHPAISRSVMSPYLQLICKFAYKLRCAALTCLISAFQTLLGLLLAFALLQVLQNSCSNAFHVGVLCCAGAITTDFQSDPVPNCIVPESLFLTTLRLLYLTLKKLVNVHQQPKIHKAEYCTMLFGNNAHLHKNEEGCEWILKDVRQGERLLEVELQLAAEVQDLSTCLGMCSCSAVCAHWCHWPLADSIYILQACQMLSLDKY